MADRNKEHPRISFSQFEQVGSFFLHEAFRLAYYSAEYEVAGVIFGESIMSIEPEPGWDPGTLAETLQLSLEEEEKEKEPDDGDITISRLAEAWHLAQAKARSSGIKLSKKHRMTAVDMVGHFINLSACVESAVNRHLFFLRESGKLEDYHYISLDQASVIAKILFAFKDEALSRKLPTSRIKKLFTFRNQAVHFKESSKDSITPTIEELLAIWREVSQLFHLIKGEPTRQDMDNYIQEFKKRWVER